MVYTISELAQMATLSARTLRYYDEIGLLKPQALTAAGYRLYSEKEVDRLQQILLYREPTGQGNVPPPPELRNAGRNIRQIKVGGTVTAHQGSEAVAHLALPGKVKVQLQRVGNDAQPGQRGGNIA